MPGKRRISGVFPGRCVPGISWIRSRNIVGGVPEVPWMRSGSIEPRSRCIEGPDQGAKSAVRLNQFSAHRARRRSNLRAASRQDRGRVRTTDISGTRSGSPRRGRSGDGPFSTDHWGARAMASSRRAPLPFNGGGSGGGGVGRCDERLACGGAPPPTPPLKGRGAFIAFQPGSGGAPSPCPHHPRSRCRFLASKRRT